MLNQGYGWAADVNLRFIFDRIFSVESGAGYRPTAASPNRHRGRPQPGLDAGSPSYEIIATLPDDIIRPALGIRGSGS